MNREKKDVKLTIKELKKLDKEKFYFVSTKLKCPHWGKYFGIEKEYIRVITCPYCGEYVEG